MLKPFFFDHSQILTFTIQITSYKNGYTPNDFMKELEKKIQQLMGRMSLITFSRLSQPIYNVKQS